MPLVPTVNETNMLLVSTMESYIPGINDAVFSKTPFLQWILDNDIFSEDQFGPVVVHTIEYGKNDTFAYFEGYSPLKNKPQAGVTEVRYDWCEWSAGLSLCRREELINRGEKAIFKLVDQKINNCVKSTAEQLNYDFLRGDGTPNADGFATHMGLDTLIGDHRSTIVTIGGIDCSVASNAFWRSVVVRPGDDGTGGASGGPIDVTSFTTTISSVDYITNNLRVIDDLIDHMDTFGPKPTFAITTPRIKRDLIAILKAEGQEVLSSADMTLRGGHDNIVYRGVMFVSDKNVPTGTIYFVNPDFISLDAMVDGWFTQTEWVRPHNQAARYAYYLGMSQFSTNNRRHLARIDGLVPAFQ